MRTLAAKLISRLVAFIPWQTRNCLYRLPIVSRILRTTLNRVLPSEDRPFPARITAGPMKGLRLEIKYQSEKFFWLGTHEPPVQKAILKLAGEGSTAYDIGAYIGFFTLLLSSRVGESGRVIACEPNPTSYRRLVRNIRLNRIRNAQCLNLAAAEKTGRRLFRLEEDNTPLEGHLISSAADSEPGLLIEVNTATLDDLVFERDLPVPDLIKIDAEGSEAQVLVGMTRILRECRPVIICEAHSRSSARQVADILERHNYSLTDLEGGTAPPGQGAERRYFRAEPSPGRSRLGEVLQGTPLT
jgi:FkbM family methyltransferase